ncbi:MAG: hypothetical protein GY702_22860 [Desulfobulbaceae bacterium]|nr:hypothetical protein [Desulfobulbaceae bacterium]
MNTIAKLTIVTCISIVISGCAGMLADGMVRATSTGETYAELAPIPTPINTDGRIYIYRTESATKNSLEYGKGISKNYIFCVVDDQGFWLLWEVFMYKDLPPGLHEISCSTKASQRGTQKLQLSLQENNELYVRIDVIENKITPVLVDAAIAKAELSNLPLLKTGPKKWERVE